MKRKLGKRQRESTNSIKKILDGAMKGLYNADTPERFCCRFARETAFADWKLPSWYLKPSSGSKFLSLVRKEASIFTPVLFLFEKALLMSTHNICFLWRNKKNYLKIITR